MVGGIVIIKAITLASLFCHGEIIINDTNFPINDHDIKMIEFNGQRCGKGMYVDTPCVSYVRKVGEKDYHLVCGVKQYE
jgi:hypothetical protein